MYLIFVCTHFIYILICIFSTYVHITCTLSLQQKNHMSMDLMAHIMQSRETISKCQNWRLLPQLLIQLFHRRGGERNRVMCMCPLCCEQSLGILGLFPPTCEHKHFYMSTIRGSLALKQHKPSTHNNKEKAYKSVAFNPTLKDSSNTPGTQQHGKDKVFLFSYNNGPWTGCSHTERRTHYLPIGWQKTRSALHSCR